MRPYQEALRLRADSAKYQEGNFTTLLCGHTIWADPRWNDVALASAIQEHRTKTSCGGPP